MFKCKGLEFNPCLPQCGEGHTRYRLTHSGSDGWGFAYLFTGQTGSLQPTAPSSPVKYCYTVKASSLFPRASGQTGLPGKDFYFHLSVIGQLKVYPLFYTRNSSPCQSSNYRPPSPNHKLSRKMEFLIFFLNGFNQERISDMKGNRLVSLNIIAWITWNSTPIG